MEIVRATSKDLTNPCLYDIDKILTEEFKKDKSGRIFNQASFLLLWKSILDLGLGVLFLLKSEDGSVHGILGASLTPDFLTGDMVATELVWVVDNQGHGNGMRLLESFESWAKESGANIIAIPIKKQSRIHKKIYSRGYRVSDITWGRSL